MFPIMLDGLLTGLTLQLAIGPVFFFILNLSLQRTVLDGFAAVIAVTLVDYIFIALAVMGVGRVLENPETKRIFGILGSIVLFMFGVVMIISAGGNDLNASSNITSGSNYLSSFIAAFTLTISSPLTILFWTGLFASRGVEKGYRKKEMIFFGLGAGLATLLFLGASVSLLSIIKGLIPLWLPRVLNICVGLVLMSYGTIRILQTARDHQDRKSNHI